MLIKLTRKGNPVYLNPQSIHAVWKNENDPFTHIHAGNKLFSVDESPETVFSLIAQATSEDLDIYYDQ